VSDLQPGSCSDVAGLQRGDMILAVNGEDFVGINYDTAAKVLKSVEGQIKMVVSNPLQPEATARQQTATAAETTVADHTGTVSPDKPKPSLPPKPVIAPKPASLSPTHKPGTAPTKAVASAGQTKPTPAASTTAPAKSANVRRPVASPRKKTPSDDISKSPATCEIVPGADTTIEITKDKGEDGKTMGLGLSIVGEKKLFSVKVLLWQLGCWPCLFVTVLYILDMMHYTSCLFDRRI
jgi:hypothetical protein